MSISRSTIFTAVVVFLLFVIKSHADTYVVTNLNDPGAGSLRQAIEDSNSHEGPDKIVFKEGLEGTIYLNLGRIYIQDDLTLSGPGAEKITIDAEYKSNIFESNDFNDETNKVVHISGLRFIHSNSDNGAGAFHNVENSTVDSSQFMDNIASFGAGKTNNKILTVDSCLFENNSATSGGAFSNQSDGSSVTILNSIFRDNEADHGGAIRNQGSIDLISSTTFSGNSSTDSGGAIRNEQGTIKEISNSTFHNNINTGPNNGGAIANDLGLIEKISNCTFSHNSSAYTGGAISDGGVSNISFSTFADNHAGIEAGAIGPSPSTRIRNSILTFNSPDNCSVPISDFGGNYSDNSTCGLTGDDSEIILGPLADNGGPTKTIALLGGDPIDGATANCDALDENGNPTGIAIGIDQRYFPRPSGLRCDSGAFETQPTASVTITKVTDPAGGTGFNFDSAGFGSLQGCGLRGDGGGFVMNDGESVNCIVPEGDYSITENVPRGYDLAIICPVAPDNITINNVTGEIEFAIEDPATDVDCIYTNTRTGGGGNGGCSLAPSGTNYTFPLYLFAPALILIRMLVKKRRE